MYNGHGQREVFIPLGFIIAVERFQCAVEFKGKLLQVSRLGIKLYQPFMCALVVAVKLNGGGSIVIYHAACFLAGDGNGFIPSRGFSRNPPSYHIERLQKAPIGYFFDVMSNGYGIMMDYSAQITPRDRWCIAAYIRALQLSQNATRADVPAGQDIPSKAPAFADPGSGATLPVLAPPKVETGKGESE